MERVCRSDRAHRLAGRCRAVAMYVAIISSFGIRELSPGHFSAVHALSIFTFCTLTLGVRAARRGDVAAHRGFMRGSYFRLVGAFVGAVAVPVRDVPQLAVHWPLTFAAAVAVCVAVSLAILAVSSAAARRQPRITSTMP